MGKLQYLLLVIFLVPRYHCNTLAGNKTGLLFDQLDSSLQQIIQEHVSMYEGYWECFKRLPGLAENYRSDQYGLVLLKNTLERYNYLTKLLNSVCKKQINEDLTEKDSSCEPFGCHKFEIRSTADQPVQNASAVILRSNITNINQNHITIWLNFTNPESTKKPRRSTKRRFWHPCHCRHCCESASESNVHWLPLPFKPWGFWAKVTPLGDLPETDFQRPGPALHKNPELDEVITETNNSTR